MSSFLIRAGRALLLLLAVLCLCWYAYAIATGFPLPN